MKSYPSITAATGQNFRAFEGYVFDKIDGSNLRWEWSPKRGWYKYGTRRRLFDETDETFGPSIEIFHSVFAQPLHDFAKKSKWRGCVAFTEFWGDNSFAGLHEPADEKRLTLIDMDIYKQGLMDPRDFLKLCDLVPSARCFGKLKWTRGFVERMRYHPQTALAEGIPSLEGVVGKCMTGRKRFMAKAKTQEWIDKVRALYSPEEAERIINS